MEPHVFIEKVFGVLAVLSGIGAAYFEFRARGQEVVDGSKKIQKRIRTREWYARKWQVIEKSSILELPDRAIGWFLGLESWLESYRSRFENPLFPIVASVMWIIAAGFLVGYVFGLIYGIITGIFILVFPIVATCDIGTGKKHPIFNTLGVFGMVVAIPAMCFAIFATLKLVLSLKLHIATVTMLLLLPFLWGSFCIPTIFLVSLDIRKDPEDGRIGRYLLIALSMTLSLGITMIALLLGYTLHHVAYVPKTIEMLVANVLFDGLTVFFTFHILRIAVNSHSSLAILLAIIVDVIVAAILACLSLWIGVGLASSSPEITLAESIRVLIGKDPSGIAFELGPYFWAMHTAFIPTVSYLLIVLLCLVGKIGVLPFARLFHRGSISDSPFHYTAGVLALMGACFGAGFFILEKVIV